VICCWSLLSSCAAATVVGAEAGFSGSLPPCRRSQRTLQPQLREVLAKLEGAGNKAEGERREWSPSHSVVEGAKEPLSHAVDRGAQRKLRQQQKKLKEEEAKLRPLRKEFHLKHGYPLGADEGEEHQVPNPGRSPNQRLITSLRRRSSMMLGSQPCSVFC